MTGVLSTNHKHRMITGYEEGFVVGCSPILNSARTKMKGTSRQLHITPILNSVQFVLLLCNSYGVSFY